MSSFSIGIVNAQNAVERVVPLEARSSLSRKL